MDVEDDEDVPIELPILSVTGVDGGGLPTSHKAVGEGIVYDEACDKTAEFLVNNGVQRGEGREK